MSKLFIACTFAAALFFSIGTASAVTTTKSTTTECQVATLGLDTLEKNKVEFDALVEKLEARYHRAWVLYTSNPSKANKVIWTDIRLRRIVELTEVAKGRFIYLKAIRFKRETCYG